MVVSQIYHYSSMIATFLVVLTLCYIIYNSPKKRDKFSALMNVICPTLVAIIYIVLVCLEILLKRNPIFSMFMVIIYIFYAYTTYRKYKEFR